MIDHHELRYEPHDVLEHVYVIYDMDRQEKGRFDNRNKLVHFVYHWNDSRMLKNFMDVIRVIELHNPMEKA